MYKSVSGTALVVMLSQPSPLPPLVETALKHFDRGDLSKQVFLSTKSNPSLYRYVVPAHTCPSATCTNHVVISPLHPLQAVLVLVRLDP